MPHTQTPTPAIYNSSIFAELYVFRELNQSGFQIVVFPLLNQGTNDFERLLVLSALGVKQHVQLGFQVMTSTWLMKMRDKNMF